MILPIVLLLLSLSMVVLLVLPKLPSDLKPYLAGLPAGAAFLGILFAGWTSIRAGESLAWSAEWMPALGVNFDLVMNGWGLLMILLVLGVGMLIMIYTFGYEKDLAKQKRLYGFLSLFMLAMAGLTMSDHLIVLFLFWELTSILSYLLVGFYHEKAESRRNALQALLITGSGGMCLLAGFILLYIAGGSWKITELTLVAEAVKAHALYPSIFTLIAIGAFTKSAQFPFHLWLPNAMVAPTPISAYLHSATMVKAGVFLLGLLFPIIGGTNLWSITLMSVGAVTLFVGGFFGLKQHDLKAILAGTTLAVLGLLILLLGIGTKKALLALCLFIVGHALYKACLFMVAGAVDKATGDRDVRNLGGLRRYMPITASVALIAALSKMGLPPFYGFIGKEYVYKASDAWPAEWLDWVLVAGNAMIFALAVKAAIFPFFKKNPNTEPAVPKSIPFEMYACPAVLAVIGLGIGMIPNSLTPLTGAAVDALVGKPVEIKVALWTGFNKALLMSGVTVILGVIVVLASNSAFRFLNLPCFEKISPNALYDRIHNGLLALAKGCTQLLQSGPLRNYLVIIIITTLGLVGWKLSLLSGMPEVSLKLPFNIIVLTLVVIMIASTIVAVTSLSKLTSLIALGVIGFSVALFFAIYSAPDLAITQILVETLIVVVFAWVIRKIGQYKKYSEDKTRLFDACLAIASGVMMTLLVLKSKTLELSAPIANALTEMSYPEGKGANVVNVILVDFRALDTLGEITVLTIAALGVWALLNQLRSGENSEES